MHIAFFGFGAGVDACDDHTLHCRGLLRGLAARGHPIVHYRPQTLPVRPPPPVGAAGFGIGSIPDLSPDWMRTRPFTPDRAGIVEVLEEIADHDAILKAGSLGPCDAMVTGALPTLRRPGLTLALWDTGPLATLAAAAADPGHAVRAVVRLYDLVIIRGGGRPAAQGFGRLGARACVPVYDGVERTSGTVSPLVPPGTEPAADLLLIADCQPDMVRRVECFLFDAARRLPRFRFLLAGSGWDRVVLPANVRRLGPVDPTRQAACLAEARAVLCLAPESWAEAGYCPPSLLFRAAAAGACILTDSWPGLGVMFEPGTEVLVAEDGAAVARIVESLTDAVARTIGAAAAARAQVDHTWQPRAALVEAVLQTARIRHAEVS